MLEWGSAEALSLTADMGAQSRTNDAISATLKTFLAVLPVSIAVYRLHGNHLTIGIACVAGVLLQTLIPPHTQRLFLLLTGAIVFTVVYSLFGK